MSRPRDQAYKLWKEAGGDDAPKGILKEIADKLELPEGTVRGWKAKTSGAFQQKKEWSVLIKTWNVPIKKVL